MELLLRLLVAVLVYWIGEKVIALAPNGELQKILSIILIIGVVLYVVVGSFFFPIR